MSLNIILLIIIIVSLSIVVMLADILVKKNEKIKGLEHDKNMMQVNMELLLKYSDIINSLAKEKEELYEKIYTASPDELEAIITSLVACNNNRVRNDKQG